MARPRARLPGSPEVSSGLSRFSSDSTSNPSFSVFSVRSVVNAQVDEQEPNHRWLRGLRESLDFNGVGWSRVGGRKAVI